MKRSCRVEKIGSEDMEKERRRREQKGDAKGVELNKRGGMAGEESWDAN